MAKSVKSSSASSPKPSVAEPISYSALKRKAAAGDLTDAEIESYFEVDQAARERHRFSVKLRSGAVTFRGKRPTPTEVNELLLKADKKRQAAETKVARDAGRQSPLPKTLRTRMLAAIASRAVKTKVLAEGDSWFRLPPAIKPKDAMDFFDETHDLDNVAMWGHTLQQMVAARQYVQKLGGGNFGSFFFSGGGNDVLASIGNFVDRRRPNDTNPANAPGYVNAGFATMLDTAMRNYRRLLADVAAIPDAADVVIFLHGYANAIPVKDGKSIGKALQAKDFDPVKHEALCRAIVSHMIGQFNERLKSLAAAARNVVYIDLRPILTVKADWYKDEIHPSASGALKISNEFARRLAENTPSV